MRNLPGGSFEILQADDDIEIDDIMLEIELVPEVTYGDGILTIHAANRTVSYGLSHHDPVRQIWHGHRSGA